MEFLRNYGKPQTKHYEFAAALIVHRLCEKQWGNNCWIGFRINRNHSGSLPAYNSQREINLEEVSKFLGKGIDEDSPVDFVVAKMASMKKAKGMVFQVKRFGIGRNKKDTDELVTYINSLRYQKTNANLLICLDDGVNIDMQKFYDGFEKTKFPFNRLIFIWLDNDTVYLKDVLPKGNTEQYSMNEIITIN